MVTVMMIMQDGPTKILSIAICLTPGLRVKLYYIFVANPNNFEYILIMTRNLLGQKTEEQENQLCKFYPHFTQFGVNAQKNR
jgi:hypothetical protein